MLRWIMLVVALVAIGAAFKITSPGLLALALLVALIAAVASFVGFASGRVDEVSLGQSSRELELLLTARKKGPADAKAPRAVRPPAAGKSERDGTGAASFLYASGASASAFAHDDTGTAGGDSGGGDAGGGGVGGGGGGGD